MFKKLVWLADSISSYIGKTVAWLTIAMMLITCLVVLLRYGFQYGSIALQESVIYLHAIVFMLGAAYTFKSDEHVRVDVFYRSFSIKKKALVNLIGGVVFLLPVTLFTFYISLEYVSASWRVLETSQEPGGLPFIYLLKTLIPLMMLTLIIQGLVDIIQNLSVLLNQTTVIQESSHD